MSTDDKLRELAMYEIDKLSRFLQQAGIEPKGEESSVDTAIRALMDRRSEWIAGLSTELSVLRERIDKLEKARDKEAWCQNCGGKGFGNATCRECGR
jgi:hypothetical protein